MDSRNRNIALFFMVAAVLGLAALALAVAQPTAAKGPAETPEQQGPVAVGIQIPVIVNVYPGGVVDPKALEAANDILKQAGMKLVVVKTNVIGPDSGGDGHWGGDNGAGDGTAGDGEFTLDERKNMRTFGGKELAALPNHKGIKISFGEVPVDGSTSPGVSVHRNPTIIVRNRETASATGQTIAHEIGHVMTLGAGHKIDNTTNANGGGHAPDQAGNSGRDNIMAPSNYRTGTHLTPDQIAEMQQRKYVHGKCATQWQQAYPATKDPQQFGVTTDNRGDHGGAAPIYDVDTVFLTSLHDAPDIQAQVTVNGVLPTDVDIHAVYGLGWDIDANMATGIIYAELPGVDRIVSCILMGNIGQGTFVVSGQIYDTWGGTIQPLPEAPVVTTDSAYVDLDAPGDPTATSCLMHIPRAMLMPMAVEMPVVATAGDMEMTYDTAFLIFDQERWLRDPTLTTYDTGVPVPGAPYPIEIMGLEPESSFTLYVDDTPVLSGTLDPAGGFAGAFIFPTGLPTANFYFLTAQDETGEFAYNITCPAELDNVIHLPLAVKSG